MTRTDDEARPEPPNAERRTSDPETGLLILDSSGHLELDQVAGRLLAEDCEAPQDDDLQQVRDAIDASDGRHGVTTLTVGSGKRAVQLNLELRPVGDSVVVILSRPSKEGEQLRRRGAIAWSSRLLHRQMAHEIRGSFHSMTLNCELLGRAARGDLGHLDNVQERQVGWVQALKEGLETSSHAFELWTGMLVDSDETDDEAGEGEAAAGEAAAGEAAAEGAAEGDEPWDLRRLLGDLDGALTPLAQRLQVELEVRYPDSPVLVQGPRFELFRLLTAATAAALQELDADERFIVDLAVRDDVARLTATSRDLEDDAEDESTDADIPEDDSETSRQGGTWSRVQAVFENYLNELGGEFRAPRQDQWTLQYPLVDPPCEES